MIEVRNLTRRFGALTAVDDISFRLEPGEVVGFLGVNGAGKTTTMRMLTGYLPATSGLVRVAGHDVLRQSLEVRRRIGYLPEAVPLYREHRLREMLDFQARLHGLGRAEARKRIPEVLERVGLADRERTLIGDLSKGLRQRAGLAVALLPDPEVLILDEPTSGLDPIQRREVRALVAELATRRTVLFSSHILPEVEAVAPRVIILHRGRIAADGRPAELLGALGGESHVRLEAFLGRDGEAAARLLGAIPGVREVVAEGRLGIHSGFRLRCAEDLREDVGALAAQRGWALRELSWHRPTLEEIFARIALDLDRSTEAAPAATPVAAPERAAGPSPTVVVSAEACTPHVAAAVPPPETGREVYNLNPFDQGAVRDLSKPKRTDG